MEKSFGFVVPTLLEKASIHRRRIIFYALQIYSFLPTPPPNQRVKTTPFGESSRFLPSIVLQDGVNTSLVAALERESRPRSQDGNDNVQYQLITRGELRNCSEAICEKVRPKRYERDVHLALSLRAHIPPPSFAR